MVSTPTNTHTLLEKKLLVTVFGKTNRLQENQLSLTLSNSRLSTKMLNGNKKVHFTRRRSVGMASNFDDGIFARCKR